MWLSTEIPTFYFQIILRQFIKNIATKPTRQNFPISKFELIPKINVHISIMLQNSGITNSHKMNHAQQLAADGRDCSLFIARYSHIS
jgi:hypothetical protein